MLYFATPQEHINGVSSFEKKMFPRKTFYLFILLMNSWEHIFSEGGLPKEHLDTLFIG